MEIFSDNCPQTLDLDRTVSGSGDAKNRPRFSVAELIIQAAQPECHLESILTKARNDSRETR